MINRLGIFIFTKDRPDTLKKTLDSFRNSPFPKYIVDDSAIVSNQQQVLSHCNYFGDCVYLGSSEFGQFIMNHGIDFPKYDFLLRSPGNIKWNLGYARNFALLYSKYLRFEKVLFSDDDIEIPDLRLIDELFQSIESYQFVGANICGLVDDSVLGHIATDLGIINERMLSGGFMVFNPNRIHHFFLNIYNEDWIWIFLQLKGKKYLQTGEVFQELADPLTSYREKIIFQEFGEIALDGVLDLFHQNSYDKLVQLSFWERILKEREEYLGLLLSKSNDKSNEKYSNIVVDIQSNSRIFKASAFKNLFEKFFDDGYAFQKLFKSIS